MCGRETFLGRHDQEVRRDLVAAHPVLDLLDRLVETQALFLNDRVHEDLMSHGRADGATGAETLGEVVPEVVVAACEVRKDRVLYVESGAVVSVGIQTGAGVQLCVCVRAKVRGLAMRVRSCTSAGKNIAE